MNDNLLLKIKDLYPDISGILSTEKIEKGFLSENYKIHTKEQDFFLKLYRFKNKNRIVEIHSVKRYFSERGIPVIMPIQTKDKNTFFEFEDGNYALFPFVNGIQPERGSLTDQQIISLGKMLGKIHLAGRDSSLGINESFKGWNKQEALDTVSLLESKFAQIENKSDFDVLAEENVSFKKELITKNKVAYADLNLVNDHLTHGDYLDLNVFFDENENVKYVFDFEKTEMAPRTQELFRSATYSFLNTDFDDKSLRDIDLFIKSYSEIYPIEQDELKTGLLVHYLKSTHGFWVEKEHYLKGSNRVDVFLKLNNKRLRFTSERLNDFLKK